MMQRDANISEDGLSAAAAPRWPGWTIATGQCVRFYSRLPVPRLPGETDPHAVPDFRTVPRALPLAALAIVLPALLVMMGALALRLPALATAALTVTTLAITCGAFHEDGLADTADGLFGGHTPERRLEIMKDSLIGSFGAMALIMAGLLRVSLLAGLLESGGGGIAAAAVIVAAGWSRAEGIRLLAIAAPARAYGAVAAVGRPTLRTAAISLALAGAIGLAAALIAGLPPMGLALGLGLASLAVTGLSALARRLIGGPTGDIAGAGQQIAEIAIYLGVLIVVVA